MEEKVNKTHALIIASAAAFLTPFMGSSVNIALPDIAREFSMSAVLIGWVATSYLLSAAIFLLPLGKAADMYGRKKILLLGMALFALFCLLTVFSWSAHSLLLFRMLNGISGAMIFGTNVAILTSVFPPQEKGKALGITVASVYTGSALGPVIGGFLTHNFGWRSIFIVSFVFCLAVISLILLKLKGEWKEETKAGFDFSGSAAYSISLALLMYGLSQLPKKTGIVMLLTGISGLFIFFIVERKAGAPLLTVGVFRHNPVFIFSNLAALINYSATFAVGFLMSLYLQYIKGLTPQAAGFILLSQPVVMAVFSPLSGRISDKVQPRIIASIGMSLIVAGLVVFIFLDPAMPTWLIIANLMMFGLGFALFSSPNINAVMSSVEKRDYGVASSVLATMRLVGQVFSMAVVTLIFSIFIGHARIMPENYHLFLKSARVSFIVLSVLCLLGIFASLARGRVESRE